MLGHAVLTRLYDTSALIPNSSSSPSSHLAVLKTRTWASSSYCSVVSSEGRPVAEMPTPQRHQEERWTTRTRSVLHHCFDMKNGLLV